MPGYFSRQILFGQQFGAGPAVLIGIRFPDRADRCGDQRLAGGGTALQVAAVDEEVVGLGKEGDTGGCQLQVLFFAGEQLYTQLVFHVLDSLAQAGLGHAQFLGRAGDIQAFRHLDEILQFIYEHNATLHFPWYYLTFQSL